MLVECLLNHRGGKLLHRRSPCLPRFQRVDNWEHNASRWGPAFSSHLYNRPICECVTEWRMQKAMQLLQERDKKLIDVARSVGYESDAAFSKALKRAVGANPGEYLERGFEGHGNAGTAEDF